MAGPDPGSPARYFSVALKADYESRVFKLRVEYRFGRTKKVILVECVEPYEDYGRRLPFAYDISEIRPDRLVLAASASTLPLAFDVYAVLRIVAGPGVSVRTEGFRLGAVPSVAMPRVEVIRVQDPALVPRQGDPIEVGNYLGMAYLPYDYWDGVFESAPKLPVKGLSRVAIDPALPIQIAAAPHFDGRALKTVFLHRGQAFYLDLEIQPPIVTALSDGIYVHDVTTDSHAVLTVPQDGDKAAGARFQWAIEYDGRKPTIVHLHSAGKVTLDYGTLYRRGIANGAHVPETPFKWGLVGSVRDQKAIFEVLSDKFEMRHHPGRPALDLPVQGETVVVDPRRVVMPAVFLLDDESRRQQVLELVAKAGADMGIGWIPVIGDLVDLFELVSGHDKWGEKMTLIDRAVTGVGLLLPFVSGGTLRTVMKGGMVAAQAAQASDAD
jgi:hypothetical protein